MSNEESLENVNLPIPLKRRRSVTPPGSHQQRSAHVSPIPSPSQSTVTLPSNKMTMRDYSHMSPRSATYYQMYSRDNRVPFPGLPDKPGRMAESREEIDAAIAHFITPIVQDKIDWVQYMKRNANPPRISEVIKQCQFAQRKVDELAGTRTPIYWDGAPALEVRKEHIWLVLKLESPSGPEGEEILFLLKLYGQHGQRYEDSRVVDMINDVSAPAENPYKRFLKLLRQIDEDWLQDNQDDAVSDH